MAFIFATLIPGMVIALLGVFYINSFQTQGQAVRTSFDAQSLASSENANIQRAIVNQEMDAVAKQIAGLTLTFPAKASETGKLYGSVTTQMIVDAIKAKAGVEIARRQIDSQPLRMLGEYKVHVRLTVDLIPTIDVVVYREGEAVSTSVPAKAAAPVAEETKEEPEPAEEPETE